MLRFDGTLANNSLSLDASHNMIVAGNITGREKSLSDDATDATSVTDGSLQTEGCLSVKTGAVIGGPQLILGEDAAEDIGIFFKGNAQNFILG